MLVKLKDGLPVQWPLAEHYLQFAHPGISFPQPLTLADIEPLGYGFFELSAQPGHDALIHDVVEVIPVKQGGVYKQTWAVVAKYSPEQETQVLADYAASQLADAKAAKNTQINRWRLEANKTTFPHAGKTIACDDLSRSDIDAVANTIALTGAFPPSFPGAWKATDNTYLPLPDVTAFKAMFASMTAQGTANFNKSQQLKAALAAAKTVAEVNAITW